jgi:alanyl-tRNA synthetase
MTDRLYYHDSYLYEFDGEIVEVLPPSSKEARHGVVLDRTAFYPSSGGQVNDTGWLESTGDNASRWKVAEVADAADGRIVHFIEAEKAPVKGTRLRGVIDAARRRDHMRQHSGQHVLSAAFVRLYNMTTVSFHMGEDYCSIDLDTPNLKPEQVVEAERLANDIVLENRAVDIRFVTAEEARTLGVRKIPPVEREKLRLIDVHDFDLTACGGTHVKSTAQIGAILLRKIEKVREGWRVEFVCGERAVTTARHDYSVLAEAAALFSSHIWDVAQQAKKTQEDAKTARKAGEQLLEEIAELQAKQMLTDTPETNNRKIIVHIFTDRDAAFVKLAAQKLTRLDTRVVALLASTAGQPGLVFGQSPGQPFDMGAWMKESTTKLGGRGGGSKDLAQGGVPKAEGVEALLQELKVRCSTQS